MGSVPSTQTHSVDARNSFPYSTALADPKAPAQMNELATCPAALAMDSAVSAEDRPNSTNPQVTNTSGDHGGGSGPPGIRTLNPPGKSRLLCAIELTARGEAGCCPSRVRTSVSASRARRPASWTNGHRLPVQDSNLGPRIQSPRCCRLHQPGTRADEVGCPRVERGVSWSRTRRGRRCPSHPGAAGAAGRRRRPLRAGPVPLPGFEPGTSAFVVRRSVQLSYGGVRPTPWRRRERPEGIEPSASAWKTDVSAEFTTAAGRALGWAQW